MYERLPKDWRPVTSSSPHANRDSGDKVPATVPDQIWRGRAVGTSGVRLANWRIGRLFEPALGEHRQGFRAYGQF
jgi:hypothetical protein